MKIRKIAEEEKKYRKRMTNPKYFKKLSVS